MSMYAEYIAEREGKRIVETRHGFATFSFIDGKCYLQDLYVRPQYRHQGVARDLSDRVADEARKQGCSIMLGSVVPTAPGATYMIRGMLSLGFELDSSTLNFIVLRREI